MITLGSLVNRILPTGSQSSVSSTTEGVLDQNLARTSLDSNVEMEERIGSEQTGVFESVSVVEASVVVETDEMGVLESSSGIEASFVTAQSNPATMVTTRGNAASQHRVKRRIKHRRGMEKMITVVTRVSGKCGESMPNPRGSQFRRVRERIYNNVVASIGDNIYKTRCNNGSLKEVTSMPLQIEESTVGVPPSETVPPLETSSTNSHIITDTTTATLTSS